MSNDIDINKAYVSPEDRFLVEFYAKHKKTASQIREIQKNGAIARMRDNKNYDEKTVVIWEDF